MMTFKYKSLICPENYKCGRCGAYGCKLWRESYTVNPEIRCVNCAFWEEGLAAYHVDQGGRHNSDLGETDNIGMYVPAVPLEDEDGWWAYAAVPDDGVKWWRLLPTYPSPVESGGE